LPLSRLKSSVVRAGNGPQFLSLQQRLSDSQNWRTVEFILEGAVFLAMGLELSAIVGDVGTDSTSIGVAAGLAAVALLLTILVRGAYVAPLLAGLKFRAGRGERMKPWIAATQDRLDDPEAAEKASERFGRRRMPSAVRMDRFRTRLQRLVADQISLELKGAPTNHGQPATRPNIMKYVIVHKS
jgi:hypothetical protein